jgi:hypothetical protein
VSHRGKGTGERVQRSTEELERRLRDQYRFLQRSAAAFDSGEHAEAVRLATSLRVLLHEGQGSCLLRQLHLIKRLRFLDTAVRPEPGQRIVAGGGLVILKMVYGPSSGATVEAPLDRRPPTNPDLRFSAWWRDAVIRGSDDQLHTREFLVREMANTEGAHVDAFVDGDYDALTTDAAGWSHYRDGTTWSPIAGDIAAASIRQIAHEVARTRERGAPEIISA